MLVNPDSRLTVMAVAAGGALVTALVAACGSQVPPGPAASGGTTSAARAGATSPASSGPATRPSSSPAVQSAPRMPATQCPTSALRVRAKTVRGGAAAGTSYVPLDFTNISGHGCGMYGFPGVSFVTGQAGGQIGDSAFRSTTFGSQTVTLPRGGTAHAWLGIADAGNFPRSSCHQVTAHWLKIYPPDQYTALYAGFTTQICSKQITNGSIPLTILPIRPGPGVPGSVP
jgi:hypothetical protein